MKITKKILENIIREECKLVMEQYAGASADATYNPEAVKNKRALAVKLIEEARAKLSKAKLALYTVPDSDAVRENIDKTIGRLFIIYDMVRGRYHKPFADQHGLILPPKQFALTTDDKDPTKSIATGRTSSTKD